MTVKALAFVFIFFLSAVTAWGAPPSDIDLIPPALEEWKDWVLYGEEDRFCPVSYNNENACHCTWPSRLNLDFDDKGGRFTQRWLIFKEVWIPLPGGSGIWPQNVKVDGKDVPVVKKGNIPSVHMLEGRHELDGCFKWNELPEIIHLPEKTGLLDLSVNNKSIEFPLLDEQGRLWLQKRKKPGTQEERLGVRIYRLLSDTIPMRVTNNLKIDVSGQAREIKIEGAVLKGFMPLSIDSSLPARLGTKGELMLQARPGRWEIQVLSRSQGPIHLIGPVETFHGQEIWAFQSQNHLRMVKIKGVPSIDPGQTDMPAQWKNFSTFIIKSGDKITVTELRRGDPDPAPDQLHLKRTLWLDFDGKGFTVQDRINGTMSRQWYLAMNPPGILGRVSVDGIDQLITSQGELGKPGVELRRGRLNLMAESRFESSKKIIPAVGWDHDCQSVSGSLNLPPGWRLLTARGVDIMPGTWFAQWTLLDLFLVLIISLALFRLWNWRWGLLALVTLTFTYHEPGAPRLVWLHLLAATALLRFLPEGWAKKFVNLWRLISIIVLLVLAVPFMVQEIRWGFYPQLEPHNAGIWTAKGHLDSTMQDKMEGEEISVTKESRYVAKSRIQSFSGKVARQQLDYPQKRMNLFQDPNVLIQTGPGLPDWKWRSFAMKWNGPVERSQELRLWLLSPLTNFFLAFVRVFLLAFLIFKLMDFSRWKMPVGNFTVMAVLMCVLILPGLAAGEDKNYQYPYPELLQELKKRLLERPDCLPECADSPEMELNVTADSLRILFQVHAVVKTAVPLPGSLESWRPKQVLLDSHPAEGLARDKDGLLWILAPEGIHSVTLTGSVPPENSFQIALPLKPQLVVVQGKGWDVQGVDKHGRVESSIKLTRQGNNSTEESLKTGAIILPPFLHVERTLLMGLDWQVKTTVRRVSPVGTPIVMSIPLIAGESVTTAGIRVEKEKALVHMGPKVREIRWTSTLERENVILLQAPESVHWTETWILDVSPIWHCDLSGIPVILHQDQSGRWRPEWKPWPGEEVSIRVSRPKAAPGRLVTIDEAKLTYIPGKRFDKAALSLKIRSSQGGQHKLTLPDGAQLQLVKIMGKRQPIREQEGKVIIPLRPGSQTVDVEWHQNSDASFLTGLSHIGIGMQAVNADIIFQMPENRWILMAAGPRLGPAVLFWTYLLVIILAAVGLGKTPWMPLKTGHWLLLGLGLTQAHPLVAIMIVGWLLALGLRRKYMPSEGWFYFNMSQIILVIWTIAALIGLYMSIQKGLLGIPDMQIAGNGSSDFRLHWTQDRIGPIMPQPWVLSLPLFVYHIFMLLWALWLAHFLLKRLSWGWQCFSEGGLWRKIILSRGKKEKAPDLAPGDSG